MDKQAENLGIGAFAEAAGVNVETIRFYQRKGLLSEPDKPYGRIRLGLFDTCPDESPAARVAHAGGQVLDKPRGRKPRRTRQWVMRAMAIGVAARG